MRAEVERIFTNACAECAVTSLSVKWDGDTKPPLMPDELWDGEQIYITFSFARAAPPHQLSFSSSYAWIARCLDGDPELDRFWLRDELIYKIMGSIEIENGQEA